MAKRFIIIYANSKLQVFDANTERKQYLDKILVHRGGKNNIREQDKVLMRMIEEGRLDEVFDTTSGGMASKTIAGIPTHLGYGVDDPK